MLGTTAALGAANKAARHDLSGRKPVSFNGRVMPLCPSGFPLAASLALRRRDESMSDQRGERACADPLGSIRCDAHRWRKSIVTAPRACAHATGQLTHLLSLRYGGIFCVPRQGHDLKPKWPRTCHAPRGLIKGPRATTWITVLDCGVTPMHGNDGASSNRGSASTPPQVPNGNVRPRTRTRLSCPCEPRSTIFPRRGVWPCRPARTRSRPRPLRQRRTQDPAVSRHWLAVSATGPAGRNDDRHCFRTVSLMRRPACRVVQCDADWKSSRNIHGAGRQKAPKSAAGLPCCVLLRLGNLRSERPVPWRVSRYPLWWEIRNRDVASYKPSGPV
jgi:hypothetical protein